ncbi:LLM class flavin-dependent oxidoreductase [Novosphingobium sp.]|uniref:LLM class flavin-dependent oxidoreductase n=1 Tax=Novosphingobium sp. TaxID=1874826 RepID=UPI0028AD6330|nr:LLM class flavin-dependent oxidoreductase [Novosphingobium sp.]
MALSFYWHLSTDAPADRGRGEWAEGGRPWAPTRDGVSRRLQINHYDYLTQVARAAELTGFDGIVVPDEPQGEEPWIVTGALLRETRRVGIVTTVAPGSASGVYLGKMAASVQRFSGDRQGWLIDSGEGPSAGDTLPVEDRAERTGELLTLLDGIWDDGPFDQEGRHFVVEKGGFGGLVKERRRPPIWLRWSDKPGSELLRQADVLLIDTDAPLGSVADVIASLRKSHPALKIAAHLPLLARAEAEDVAVEHARRNLSHSALVGTFDEVVAKLGELAQAGLDIAVLSAPDQIQEVHIAGEQVIGRFHASAALAA